MRVPFFSKDPTKAPRTPKQRVVLGLKVFIIGFLSLALIGTTAFLVAYESIDVPDPKDNLRSQTTFVLYADGETELGKFAIQNRELVALSDVPPAMKNAVIAAENRSFYEDQGVDVKGILRAAFSNVQGNSTQGASTITQQYVKNVYLSQEQTYRRKVKEAILSLKIHRTMSKDEILEGYLNVIYFGRGAYGVQAAAKAYFDKPVQELTLRECAVLAAIINSPETMDPASGEEAVEELTERYRYVLSSMEETGVLETEQVVKASAALPKFKAPDNRDTMGAQRGHVLTMVRAELKSLGFTEREIDAGGLRVVTTFTPKAMQAAADGVAQVRPDGFGPDGFGPDKLHAAVASVDTSSGAVLGIYAGQDFLDSELNWAIEGGQTGSTFKPFAVAAAIEDGFSLKDRFAGNSPYKLPDGTEVTNVGDNDYGKKITLVEATQDSVNTAFVDMTLGMSDGPRLIVETANRMGIPLASGSKFGIPKTSPGLEPVTSVALGPQTVSPINMAAAYGTIANGGRYFEPFVISKVLDPNGRTLYEREDTGGVVALDSDIAADVSYAMQQVVQKGSGTAALALGRPAAGKTGTATRADGAVSSSWFVGFTPQVSTAVMYVRGDGTGQLDGWLPTYYGGGYPAQTWTAVMADIMEGVEVVAFPPPVFVDGEAPSPGFEPKPKKTKEPKPSASASPSASGTPTVSPTPSEEPTTMSPSPSQEPTTSSPTTSSPTLSSSPSASPSASSTPTARSSASSTVSPSAEESS